MRTIYECLTCEASVRPDEDERRLGIARCSVCGDTVELDELHAEKASTGLGLDLRSRRAARSARVDEDRGAPPAHGAIERVLGPPSTRLVGPMRIIVRRGPGAVTLSWRWGRAKDVVGLAAATLFWNGILAVFWGALVTGHAHWLLVLLLIPHSAVGLCLAFGFVCCLVNRTTVRCDRMALTVERTPIPIPRRVALDAESICRLGRARDGQSNGSPRLKLVARLEDGSTPTILHWLDRDALRFVRHELESTLGLDATSTADGVVAESTGEPTPPDGRDAGGARAMQR